MTTIIDALVVTLGLDATNFVRAQGAAAEGIKKFRGDTGKTATEVEREAKRMQEAFGGVERSIMRLSTVFLGFAGGIGFVTFLANIQKSIAELHRLGQMLGQSGADMYKWQQVGAQVGATAEEIAGSYKSLVQNINDYMLGTGQASSVLRWFAGKGVQFTGPGGTVRSQSDIYKEINRAVQGETPGRQESLLRGLGLSEGTVRMLQQSPEKLAADLSRAPRMSPAEMKEAADAQAKLNSTWSETIRLAAKLGNLTLPVVNAVMGTLNKILTDTQREVDGLTKAFDRFDKWFSGTWIGRMAAKILGEPVSKGTTQGSFDQRFGTWERGGTTQRPGWRPSDAPPAASGSSSSSTGNSDGRGGGRGALMIPPFASALGGGSGTDALAKDREKFARELAQKPALREKIMGIAAGENKDPTANLAVIESMMNRASARGTSLETAAALYKRDPGGYYAGYDPGALNRPKIREMIEGNVSRALGGSNVSNYATDNASAGLAARNKASGRFTSTKDYAGESFFSPGSAGRGAASRQRYEQWRAGLGRSGNAPTEAGKDSWGNEARAIPWLQPNGMSIIKGIPVQNNSRSSSSETHIGSFTVNTEPRSNPYGMAAQIKEAVERSNIMDNSNSGPN